MSSWDFTPKSLTCITFVQMGLEHSCLFYSIILNYIGMLICFVTITVKKQTSSFQGTWKMWYLQNYIMHQKKLHIWKLHIKIRKAWKFHKNGLLSPKQGLPLNKSPAHTYVWVHFESQRANIFVCWRWGLLQRCRERHNCRKKNLFIAQFAFGQERDKEHEWFLLWEIWLTLS